MNVEEGSMQNILSWLDWRRSSEQKDLEELKHLQTLVNNIFEKFFGPLMQEYAANKQLAVEDVKKKPLAQFNKSIVEGLKIENPTAAQSLQERFHTKRYRNHIRCLMFINQLETLFSNKDYPKTNPEKVPNIQITIDTKILTMIAYALQETVICIPKIMYSGTEQVPDNVEDRLTAFLKYIDSV